MWGWLEHTKANHQNQFFKKKKKNVYTLLSLYKIIPHPLPLFFLMKKKNQFSDPNGINFHYKLAILLNCTSDVDEYYNINLKL